MGSINLSSENKPLVSVVINYFNVIEFVHEAIESVIEQSYENWEIILFDNASKDNLKEQLGRYDSISQSIKFFKNKKTVNLAKARNQAINETSGEFITFLDCDDLWHKEKLSLQLKKFTSKQVGCVYTNYAKFNKHGLRDIAFSSEMPSGNLYQELMFNDFICFSSLMVKREVFDLTKIFFDPELNYVEDEDFLIRISREWNFGYVHSVLTDYRMHGNSLTAQAKLEFRDEEEYLLERYSSEFDDFDEEKISFYSSILQKNRAVTLWRLGQGNNARKTMYFLALKNSRFFIIYLAMYFNHNHIDSIRKIFSKNLSTYEP